MIGIRDFSQFDLARSPPPTRRELPRRLFPTFSRLRQSSATTLAVRYEDDQQSGIPFIQSASLRQTLWIEMHRATVPLNETRGQLKLQERAGSHVAPATKISAIRAWIRPDRMEINIPDATMIQIIRAAVSSTECITTIGTSSSKISNQESTMRAAMVSVDPVKMKTFSSRDTVANVALYSWSAFHTACDGLHWTNLLKIMTEMNEHSLHQRLEEG